MPGGVGVLERTVVVRSINPQKYKDKPSPSQLFALLILPEVHVGMPSFQKVKYRMVSHWNLSILQVKKIIITQFIGYLRFLNEIPVQVNLLEVDFLSS